MSSATVTVPLTPIENVKQMPTAIDGVGLDFTATVVIQQLRQALSNSGAKLANGLAVATPKDAVLWLFEQIKVNEQYPPRLIDHPAAYAFLQHAGEKRRKTNVFAPRASGLKRRRTPRSTANGSTR
jgi:hypothetical protein